MKRTIALSIILVFISFIIVGAANTEEESVYLDKATFKVYQKTDLSKNKVTSYRLETKYRASVSMKNMIYELEKTKKEKEAKENPVSIT